VEYKTLLLVGKGILEVKKDGSQKYKIWGTRTHKWQKIECCPV
jgi:hypothetical protein